MSCKGRGLTFLTPKLGWYRHFKGGLYRLASMSFSRDPTIREGALLLHYVDSKKELHTRTFANFFEKVEVLDAENNMSVVHRFAWAGTKKPKR